MARESKRIGFVFVFWMIVGESLCAEKAAIFLIGPATQARHDFTDLEVSNDLILKRMQEVYDRPYVVGDLDAWNLAQREILNTPNLTQIHFIYLGHCRPSGPSRETTVAEVEIRLSAGLNLALRSPLSTLLREYLDSGREVHVSLLCCYAGAFKSQLDQIGVAFGLTSESEEAFRYDLESIENLVRDSGRKFPSDPSEMYQVYRGFKDDFALKVIRWLMRRKKCTPWLKELGAAKTAAP